ncbi:MAG: DUF1292 domain-containing protein [Syntrophothermus sp.]
MTEEWEEITLVDEDGIEHHFVVLDVVEVSGNRYAVLLPEEEKDEDEASAVIFRIETDAEGEDVLVDIEDDDEFDRVVKVLDEMAEAEEDDDEDDGAERPKRGPGGRDK